VDIYQQLLTHKVKMDTDRYVIVDDDTVGPIRQRLHDCVKLLDAYQWIINSFVLDYFIDSHWPHLPPSWRLALTNTSPESLSSLLDDKCPAKQEKIVWPLSLLAFKQAIHKLALNREQVDNLKFVETFLKEQNLRNKKKQSKKEHNQETRKRRHTPDAISNFHNFCDSNDAGISETNKTTSFQSSTGLCVDEIHTEHEQKLSLCEQQLKVVGPGKFEFYEEMLSVFSGNTSVAMKHIFRKHVKPKKQYELARLGKFTKDVMTEMSMSNLIDVGAGQGHLARYLSYAHFLQVACIDSNADFTDSANKFDKQLEESIKKLGKRGESFPSLPTPPTHVNAYLHPDMDLQSFHSILATRFHISNSVLKYGIIGLHTCGDLGPVLYKMFTNDSKARVLLSVGCCYMKIERHFPMADFTKEVQTTTKWRLTYTNSELACHAVEMYTDRLRAGDREKLKVHCYRAVLEKLLVNKDPKLKHSILKSVARAHQLPFKDYAKQATSKLPVSIDPEELDTNEIHKELNSWWDVVTYYTIRLALAPVLETVVLLDRCLYLYENGHRCLLIPLFDPSISPRNQIIFAVKR